MRNGHLVEPVETQHPSSPTETTELLSSENCLSSPYRSQSSVESPAQRTSKQCNRVPGKQQEKTPPLTVYITLDMFEQGQGRWNKNKTIMTFKESREVSQLWMQMWVDLPRDFHGSVWHYPVWHSCNESKEWLQSYIRLQRLGNKMQCLCKIKVHFANVYPLLIQTFDLYNKTMCVVSALLSQIGVLCRDNYMKITVHLHNNSKLYKWHSFKFFNFTKQWNWGPHYVLEVKMLKQICTCTGCIMLCHITKLRFVLWQHAEDLCK